MQPQGQGLAKSSSKLKELVDTYNKIVELMNKTNKPNPKDLNDLLNLLQKMTELQIWGEKFDQSFFE